MTDYQTLLDDETRAFIARSDSFYPPDTATKTIAEQRAVYDRMCQAFDAPHPPGLTVQDAPMGGVPCRIYEPAKPGPATILYFHGGGFVVGGLESHDAICAELASLTGCRLISADYRLAPEHKHPAQFDDALAATRAVAARWPGRLLLAGDSAGGNLAAAVAQAARRHGPQIAGVVLVYPGLGGPLDTPSMTAHAHAPMLSASDVAFYHDIRFGPGGHPKADPTAAPLQDTDFRGLPPTLIHVAEADPLASEGELYAQRLRAAGVPALSVTDKGLVHGHLRARHSVARARASFDAIAKGLTALAQGQIPWRGAL